MHSPFTNYNHEIIDEINYEASIIPVDNFEDLSTNLDSADFYGQIQLNRADVSNQIPRLTNNEFSSSNWYQYISKPTWLGVKINDGVHVLLHRKLQVVETWLLSQPQYKGMNSFTLGRALGFNDKTRFSGARLSKDKQAMHGFGLALDINVIGNPWIGAGWIKYDKLLLQERYRMIQTLRNASGDQSLPGKNIFEYLSTIAQSNGYDTSTAYNTLKQRNDQFISYINNIPSELSYWKNSQSFKNRNPLNGFLNLHPDLVYALRQIAGLAWGAIDFGLKASGDIMHFDLRTIGVGKFLCQKIGGFVPKTGHPSLKNEIISNKINKEQLDNLEMAVDLEFHEAIEETEWELNTNEFEEYESELYEENEKEDEAEEIYNDENSEEFEYENLYHDLVPTNTLSDVRRRIDEYFDLSNVDYTLKDGTIVKARSQFRYARKGQSLLPEGAKALIKKTLRTTKVGKAFVEDQKLAIHYAAYGRPHLEDIKKITQVLIDIGELDKLRITLPDLSNEQLIRKLQRTFGIGIDCAGYVQLAYLYAYTGSDDDPKSKRIKLGLHEKRGYENLRGLKSNHFKKLNFLDAQTGDLLIMYPRVGDVDQAGHTVIVVNHLVNGTVHSFNVDASWGTDMYGENAGGIARRTTFFNTSSGEWSDKHPLEGDTVNQNFNGPYAGHPIQGLYRPMTSTGAELKEIAADEFDMELENDVKTYENKEDEVFGKIYELNDWSNAINQNKYYKEKLGWGQFYSSINNLVLPYSDQNSTSLSEEAFARAIAAWQQQQGFAVSESDGILGQYTWNRMKSMLNLISQVPPNTGTLLGSPTPAIQNIFKFNQWHAQKILDTINSGIIGFNPRLKFNPKVQLEKIVRGELIINVNPNYNLIQILPIIYTICEQAKKNNYKEILIGSFIREPKADGTCTGHCTGRCIDINFRGGSFNTVGSIQMVINILNYLLALPSNFKKNFGFGMPFQGSFFGNKNLNKFISTNPENLFDPQLRHLIPQLGIVFPDNDNHLHIQVGWL